MSRLEGKVAIVTGGSGGIGKGIALQLAARGATVVISGRSATKAEPILAEIRQAGGIADFLAGDVRSKTEMDGLAAETARRYGGIDIIVANAGGNDDEARSPQVRGPHSPIVRSVSQVLKISVRSWRFWLPTSQPTSPVRLSARRAGSPSIEIYCQAT